jgi:hypothetical protein
MSDESSSLDVERVQNLGIQPEREYVLLTLEYGRAPGDAVVERGQYDSLDDIVIPPPNDRMGFVVYDQEGTAYTRGEL